MGLHIKSCCVAITLLCTFACTARAAGNAAAIAQVRQTLEAYEQAWSRHDPQAAADFYYTPAMHISHDGPKVRTTHKEVLAFFRIFLPNIAKAGLAYNRWTQLSVHLIDAHTAFASGVVTGYRADGSVFRRQVVTYGLWDTPQGWKIFLSATHSPDTAMHLH